ncbi:MAG: hypothetical protein QXU29_02400 [Candidatus Nitrosocaldus sp.]
MGVVSSSVKVGVDPDTAFRFIADPKNIEIVYPESLRFRVLECPEQISEGSRIRMEARLLGQRFEWESIVRDYREGIGFTDEAVGSPFLMWRHTHTVRDSIASEDNSNAYRGGSSKGCIIDDRIEFRTILGPIGDRFAERMISSILEYRNHRMREVLEDRGERVEVEYNDPTVISLAKGTALCIIATIIGLLIPIYAQGIGDQQLILLIANGIAWFLLWFFTHDLLHLIVGRLVGVRFSHFYIGISNLVRALNVSPKYRMLFIALGIKIDREGSRASKHGYAAMYISGPLASMLAPFYIPLYMLSQGISTVALLFLTLSLINLILDAIMSYRHGCIRKGVRALTKQ